MYLCKHYQTAVLILVIVIGALFHDHRGVVAQDNSQPKPVLGPRLDPSAIPHSEVIDGDHLFNDLVYPRLPLSSREADIDDDGRKQAEPGQGVQQQETSLGQGATLYRGSNVCNDFNDLNLWASHGDQPTDIWSDHYAGWGAFALNDEDFYRSANVVFSIEQSIGPGNKAGVGQYSAKISSFQPYAAGFASPSFAASPGSEVVVTAKYLIFDHDTSGQDFDWVSLGLKADAEGPDAKYVNGYTRGRWAQLTNRVTAGSSGKVMALIQAQSPAALNSNIYFDDIAITIDGRYLDLCIFE